MTLAEAKALMTPEALDRLHEVTTLKPSINMDNKANNDILMSALCRAVNENVILIDSLDDKTIKLLNAQTNTLSPSKLGHILSVIHENQPNIGCVVSLIKPIDELICQWVFTDKHVNLIGIFEFMINHFNLDPTTVRVKMSEMLKPTIVNNIAQSVAKFQNGDDTDRTEMNISITTLTRIANMCDHMLFAEFKNVKHLNEEGK